MMPFPEKAVALLARAYRANDNCNPDVGFGWPDQHFIDIAARELGLDPATLDMVTIRMKVAEK